MLQNQVDTHHKFTKNLIGWWKDNKREFPWRNSDEPYDILIAELMLRRTSASQVRSVYLSFLARFPDISALRSAGKEELFGILQPLGLNWRIEGFSDLAKALIESFDGVIPAEKDELMSLPGVGDYVASAIRCFAFGIPDIIADTNTSRVISRVIGIDEKKEMRRNRKVREAYLHFLDRSNPPDFNYALLDLGALICTSKNQKCEVCPILALCQTGRRRRNH